ncbi:MAG: hypothetical protein AB8I08_28495 [Sandaracinaceae bacterium]
MLRVVHQDMAFLLDLLTRASVDPNTLGRVDPLSRPGVLAAHVDMVADVTWRLAFVAAQTPTVPCGSPERRVLAQRRLTRHPDPTVRAIAELARCAGDVAEDLRAGPST